MIIIQSKEPEQALEEKIMALLRREHLDAAQFTFSSQCRFTFPGLTIDGRSRQAIRDGTVIPLTRNEFNLLLFLAANAGVVCSKEELFRAVWGPDSRDTMKVVVNTVSNLRKKLHCGERDSACICTVRDGYVLSAPQDDG